MTQVASERWPAARTIERAARHPAESPGRASYGHAHDADSLIGPTSHYFYSQRLKLHYVDWGNAGEAAAAAHPRRSRPRAQLGLGGAASCATTTTSSRPTCAATATRSGRSAAATRWSTTRSTWRSCSPRSALDRVTIIGHSLGGSIALQYTGIYPDRVREGRRDRGPRTAAGDAREQPPAHERMRVWIDEMQSLARRHPHRYATLDEAVARMQDANPRLTAEQARHLTVHGSYRDEDGTYLWKFDNYVRATSPYLFNMKDARDLWTQITCPVLLLRGTESWASDPEIDGRAQGLPQLHASSTSRGPATGCTTTSSRSSCSWCASSSACLRPQRRARSQAHSPLSRSARDQADFAMKSTTTRASSSPLSSCRKWPAPTMVVCGCPFAPGMRSWKNWSPPRVIGSDR